MFYVASRGRRVRGLGWKEEVHVPPSWGYWPLHVRTQMYTPLLSSDFVRTSWGSCCSASLAVLGSLELRCLSCHKNSQVFIVKVVTPSIIPSASVVTVYCNSVLGH